MRLPWIFAALMAVAVADASGADKTDSKWAVGPQYDSTHVYVAAEDLDRFVASFIGTFGGTASKKATVTVTPVDPGEPRLSPGPPGRRVHQRVQTLLRWKGGAG
jgi:hypothetical protein